VDAPVAARSGLDQGPFDGENGDPNPSPLEAAVPEKPAGIYRRRIRISVFPDAVETAMEDDNHHFLVSISHDGERVTQIHGHGVRTPWSTCVGASSLLQRLIGIEMGATASAMSRQADLAVLAITHAGAHGEHLQYDLAITDPVDGPHGASLHTNGTPTLEWDLVGDRIVGPDPFTGLDLRSPGFGAWARAHLSSETIEPVIVLRRGCQISLGRERILDRYETAADLPPRTTCYAQSPMMAAQSLRIKGSSRDHTESPDRLLERRPAHDVE
jgi:hypothetical protein